MAIGWLLRLAIVCFWGGLDALARLLWRLPLSLCGLPMVFRGLRQERFLYFFRASVRNIRQFSVEVQLRCFAVFRAVYMVICCSAIGWFGCFCSAFVGVAFVFLGSSMFFPWF